MIDEKFKEEGMPPPKLTENILHQLIDKIGEFPLIKNFIHAQLYKRYLVNRPDNKTGTIPKKYGLSDERQILEASYCDIFLTNETTGKLVKHLRCINQTQIVMTLSALYDSLN